MKKAILFSLVVALLAGLSSCGKKENRYTINGTITGADTGWVILKKREEGKFVTADSVKFEQGKFAFEGTVEGPELYYLIIKDANGYVPFFIENAEITMKLDVNNPDKAEITGSATQDTYKEYLKQEETYSSQESALYEQYMQAQQVNDTAKAKQLETAFDSLNKAKMEFTKSYILKNGKSVVSAYLALSNAYMLSLEELSSINKAFDPSLATNKYVVQLKEREEILNKVKAGNPAPEFTQNDTVGNPVSLSSFKGKVVLVDFWASWCRPCRAENPNVVAAFNKYGLKGFTVLGVSLDEKKEDWLAAIKKDGLTWTHVSDLQGWNNAASKQYGVMSIPANFLLDAEGKIIGSDLRGEALEAKLEEVFATAQAAK